MTKNISSGLLQLHRIQMGLFYEQIEKLATNGRGSVFLRHFTG